MKILDLFIIGLIVFGNYELIAKDTTQTLTIYGDAGVGKALNKSVGNFGLRMEIEDKEAGLLLSTYAKYGTGGGDTIRSGQKGIFANPFQANIGVSSDLSYLPHNLSYKNFNFGFKTGFSYLGVTGESSNLLWGFTVNDPDPQTRAYVKNVGIASFSLGTTLLYRICTDDTTFKNVSLEIEPKYSRKFLINDIASSDSTVINLRNKSLEITTGQTSFDCFELPISLRIKSFYIKYNLVQFLNKGVYGSVSSVSFGFEDSLLRY